MERTARVNGAALAGMMMVAMVAAPGVGEANDAVTLEKAAYGPYGAQSLVVANSAGSWRQLMAELEAAGALAITPAPEPPTDVDWSHEVVVLVAAGPTGYDVEVEATRLSNGRTKVAPKYTRIGNDGGESLPYHLVKLPKTAYLSDMVATGSDVAALLPLVGDVPLAAAPASWGQLKAAYR